MTRYIDGDICIAKIKDMPVTYDSETVQRCIEVVSNAPTIEAEPVRHGKWKSQGDCGVTECSCCGWNIEECVGWNYCPNCGARMDEE